MTHAEFRATHPSVTPLEPTDCPGELVAAGLDEELRIQVYRCAGCGRTVSQDLESGRVLNDYEDPRPWLRGLVAGLAARTRLPAR